MNKNTRINWVFNRVIDSGWKPVTIKGKKVLQRAYKVVRSDNMPVVAVVVCGLNDPPAARVSLQKAAQCLLLSYDGCDCTLSTQCFAHTLAAKKDQMLLFQKAAEQLSQYNAEDIRRFIVANCNEIIS